MCLAIEDGATETLREEPVDRDAGLGDLVRCDARGREQCPGDRVDATINVPAARAFAQTVAGAADVVLDTGAPDLRAGTVAFPLVDSLTTFLPETTAPVCE